MVRLANSSSPSDAASATTAAASDCPARSEAIRRTPRKLATQTPHELGYSLQQFVRLAGAQCRGAPDDPPKP